MSDEFSTESPREFDVRIGKQTEAIWERIMPLYFRNARCVQSHAGVAEDYLRDPSLKNRISDRVEQNGAAYSDRLPSLVEETWAQDKLCADAWKEIDSTDGILRYEVEVAALSLLLLEYKYSRIIYEKIMRQPEKQTLQDAIRLIATRGDIASPRQSRLESQLRMKLPEFVASERQLEAEFKQLDCLRAEIISRYEPFIHVVIERLNPVPGLFEAARPGLRKAAGSFTHTKGYLFTSYAIWWILQAIERAIPGTVPNAEEIVQSFQEEGNED